MLRAGTADYVVVPKVSSPADLPSIPPLPVLAMIETPAAILGLATIAADARVAGLIAGLNDLAEELRLPGGVDRAAMSYGLQAIVMAARAHGAWCFDGVCNAIDDADASAAEAREAYRLGYDGKSLIHPGQIASCNAAWLPDPADVDDARRMVAAAADGAERFDGRMIEAMHVAAARRLIARADLSARR